MAEKASPWRHACGTAEWCAIQLLASVACVRLLLPARLQQLPTSFATGLLQLAACLQQLSAGFPAAADHLPLVVAHACVALTELQGDPARSRSLPSQLNEHITGGPAARQQAHTNWQQ
jgi:hypothetical protein